MPRIWCGAHTITQPHACRKTYNARPSHDTQQVDGAPHLVRCPHHETANKMAAEITAARDDKDSVGGIVSCVIRNCPTGEPDAHAACCMSYVARSHAADVGLGALFRPYIEGSALGRAARWFPMREPSAGLVLLSNPWVLRVLT